MKTRHIQWVGVGAIALVWLGFVLFGNVSGGLGGWGETWPMIILLSIALLPSLYMLYKALEKVGQ